MKGSKSRTNWIQIDIFRLSFFVGHFLFIFQSLVKFCLQGALNFVVLFLVHMFATCALDWTCYVTDILLSTFEVIWKRCIYTFDVTGPFRKDFRCYLTVLKGCSMLWDHFERMFDVMGPIQKDIYDKKINFLNRKFIHITVGRPNKSDKATSIFHGQTFCKLSFSVDQKYSNYKMSCTNRYTYCVIDFKINILVSNFFYKKKKHINLT